ncbi:hypothetical protein E3N88_08479 [Mikania micrantha]|uniref:Uncharacterized protein n=1 Tax=Mikania micrantha TaxID=192012 RepID=A0A5N6PIL2_9ASTR|nr:hypothetical protein E3N88_08479 [Mikania micrantha]
MDGRRHSVDLPISKTLIALRRVRSLRDPDTISLSRLPNFVDNLNWETKSTNEIVLEQVNNCLHEVDTSEANNLGLFRRNDDHDINWEPYRAQNSHKPKPGLCKKTIGLLQTIYNDLPCTMPTRDYMEGVGSCNESEDLFLGPQRQAHNEFKRKSNRRKHYKPSKFARKPYACTAIITQHHHECRQARLGDQKGFGQCLQKSVGVKHLMALAYLYF